MSIFKNFGRPGNGHHRPADASVPILGQPFGIAGWHCTVLVICRCEAARERPMLVTNLGWTACRACGKRYTLQGVQAAPGQPPGFQIGIQPAAVPQAAEPSSGPAAELPSA